MPFTSKSQQRWGHSPDGEKALGGPDKVSEWDASTDFKDLPEKKPGAISQALKKPKDMKKSGPGAIGARFRGNA